MEILEYLYELQIPKQDLLHRKVSHALTSEKLELIGAPRSGKTSLIFFYLSQFDKKRVLYIPLNDLRVKSKIETKELNNFIIYHNIDVVAIDDYDLSFELPRSKTLIFSCNKPTKLENFKSLFVELLDFEEYLLFEKKFLNMEHSMNSYLKDGAIPEISLLQEHQKVAKKQEIIKNLAKDETELFIILDLIDNICNKFTLYQHYSLLKKEIKISKDRYYSFIPSLVESKSIYLLERFLNPNAPKKIYSFDFSLKSAISTEKNIIKTFENMLFLELNNSNFELYYLDKLDFFIPEESKCIISAPFANELFIDMKLKNCIDRVKKYEIKRVIFVTLTFELNPYYFDDIEIVVLPFYSFVLSK